jgi:hypothetical protein
MKNIVSVVVMIMIFVSCSTDQITASKTNSGNNSNVQNGQKEILNAQIMHLDSQIIHLEAMIDSAEARKDMSR